MTVIAFRPRAPNDPQDVPAEHPSVTGTFRSPRGRAGLMMGFLRVQRLVLTPRGAFLTGVFAGELREADGSVIGVDSRRVTTAVDLVRGVDGYAPVVRPLQLDLMGIVVDVDEVRVDPAIAFPRPGGSIGHLPLRRARRARGEGSPS